ncbi:hypothetical protein VKT23_013941 [Stygiomarasmius scandens]|uniref:Uncharacterized protein n=1 Tax=Marasmiellus scandens TaxID=2682957 RepID=A0ABR1J4X3_9AGAR
MATLQAQLSPHISVDLIACIPGTFGIEGDESLRRAHEAPKTGDDAQLECFTGIHQSNGECVIVREVHTQPLAGSSLSSDPSPTSPLSNSPRPLTRSTPIPTASTSTSFSSSKSKSSVSLLPAQPRSRTLASLGRTQTQILPSSSSSFQPTLSDNPKRTFSNTSVASAASLAHTEPDIDWDNPTEAKDELGKLGIKVVDFAFTSSGREDKEKGKTLEKSFIQIPVDVDDRRRCGYKYTCGLPIDNDMQGLLAELVRQENMKRKKGKRKADGDDEHPDIREWIEEYSDHGIKQAVNLTEEEPGFCKEFGVGKRKVIEEDSTEGDKGKRRRVDESSTDTSATSFTSVPNTDNNNLASSPCSIPNSPPSKKDARRGSSSMNKDPSPRKKRIPVHGSADEKKIILMLEHSLLVM